MRFDPDLIGRKTSYRAEFLRFVLEKQIPLMKNTAKTFCLALPHLSIDVINARRQIQLTCHCNTAIARRPTGLLTIALQQIKVATLNQEKIDSFEDFVNGSLVQSEGKLSKSQAHGNFLTSQNDVIVGFLSIWYFISPKIPIFW